MIYGFRTHIMLLPPNPRCPALSCSTPRLHARQISAPPSQAYDLRDTLDKLKHSFPQLSDNVRREEGFYSFRAQID